MMFKLTEQNIFFVQALDVKSTLYYIQQCFPVADRKRIITNQ